MTSDRVPDGVLTAALERALRAPSVHNTQPWRWRLTDGGVELHADPTRHLVATDPDRRDLVLSCGAALHHLRVAVAAAGLEGHVRRLPDPEDRWHLATVDVRRGTPDRALARLAPAVEARRTDRRPLGPEQVPAHVLDALVALAAAAGATLLPVTDPAARRRLDELVAEAAARQRFAPGYAAELTIWTHRSAASRDGIPAAALPARGVDAAGLRPFPRGRLTSHGPGPDGSVVLVLTTVADEVLDRLLAGEATSAVLLGATLRGLATTPLSQAHETEESRHRLATHVLRTPDHPQLMIRAGRPAPGAARLEPTERRPLESVLMRS
ncbi:MAG: NAD(P)H nitroreductase [Pseudonocardiales bacterium]|nr:NAD(P)H nitroreductase [Pseudonocardiales bacterium]